MNTQYEWIIKSINEQLLSKTKKINQKIYNIAPLYRWFILNNSGVAKLDEGIYLVDSKNNRADQLKSAFIHSIVHTLKTKHACKYIHTSCTLNKEYGNLTGRKDAKSFLVVPLGDFIALQTPLATDLVCLLDKTLPDKLKELNKPYTANAFKYYTDLSIYPRDSNILSYRYNDLKRSAPYFIKAVEDAIVESYQSIENKIYHDGEVLLYCEEYLLIDMKKFDVNTKKANP